MGAVYEVDLDQVARHQVTVKLTRVTRSPLWRPRTAGRDGGRGGEVTADRRTFTAPAWRPAGSSRPDPRSHWSGTDRGAETDVVWAIVAPRRSGET